MADIEPDVKRTPRYIEVASDLRERIERGEYAVGSVLPTETELCKTYAVSRYTIREALRRLQDANIVSRRQGSGTIVTSQERAALFQQELGSLEDLIQYASDVVFDLSAPEHVDLPESLWRYVDQTETEGWAYRRADAYQRHLRRPVAISHIYMPPKYRGVAEKVQGNRGALFHEFEVYSGHSIEQVEQEIRAVTLSPEDCAALQCPIGQAGLLATRAYYDSEGPAMISISYHPGDRYAYHLRFDRKT